MKVSAKAASRLTTPPFWLTLIAGGLVSIHLHGIWQSPTSVDQMSFSLFCIGAIGLRLWQKRHQSTWDSSLPASLTGALLISWIMLRTSLVTSNHDVLQALSLLIGAIGLSLLASGWSGIRQYWQELLITTVIVIPTESLPAVIERTFGVTQMLARISNFWLWYLGFDVTRQGTQVILPGGTIDVYLGCSGIDAMLLMSRLAIVLSMFFPGQFWRKLMLPGLAILLAFLITSVRVTLLALIVSFSTGEVFSYWHGAAGSQVFSSIAIVIFGGLCQLLLRPDPVSPDPSPTQAES